MNRTRQSSTPVIQVDGTEHLPERVASSPFSLIQCLLPRFDTPPLPWRLLKYWNGSSRVCGIGQGAKYSADIHSPAGAGAKRATPNAFGAGCVARSFQPAARDAPHSLL